MSSDVMNLTSEKKPSEIAAVVLAAGKGKRLLPYTKHVPKPLVKVAGRPILEYVLLGLIKAGIRHFFIVVGYKAEMIEDWVQNSFCFDLYCKYEQELNTKIGPVAFSFIKQSEINGTGGAALLAENHIKLNGYDAFLLTYGDILVSYSVYKRLIEESLYDSADIYLVGNPTDDPSNGAAIYYEDSYVIDLIEKPGKDAPKTDLNNAGIYIFHSSFFDKLKQLKPSKRGELEITQPISDLCAEARNKALKNVKLIKMNKDEFWCDIGRKDVLERLNKNKDWLKKLF
ncbi:MAG: sugar phosphate nucleotidyltransferase [Promethearchaeota archaeon]